MRSTVARMITRVRWLQSDARRCKTETRSGGAVVVGLNPVWFLPSCLGQQTVPRWCDASGQDLDQWERRRADVPKRFFDYSKYYLTF